MQYYYTNKQIIKKKIQIHTSLVITLCTFVCMKFWYNCFYNGYGGFTASVEMIKDIHELGFSTISTHI